MWLWPSASNRTTPRFDRNTSSRSSSVGPERQLGVAAGDLVIGAQRVGGVERRQRRLQVLGMVELGSAGGRRADR